MRLRWLKPLVIVQGIIFLGLMAAVIVIMITGLPGRGSNAAPPTASVPQLPPGLEGSLLLPKNSRVLDLMASGDRLILRIRLADGTERIYAIDSRSLKPIGGLTIQVER